MPGHTFSCRPVSRQASFEIAAKFADDLELNRSKTLFLSERMKLIALLTRAIENGEVKLTAITRNDTADHVSISASLTSGFLMAPDGKPLEQKSTSIYVNSSLIECLDIPTASEITPPSGTNEFYG